jgi:hypothetical protein
MIAVAVVGVTIGVIERRNRFKRRAVYHQAEFMKLASQVPPLGGLKHPNIPRLEWHYARRLEYERAARRPWLPVPPDPPPPE